MKASESREVDVVLKGTKKKPQGPVQTGTMTGRPVFQPVCMWVFVHLFCS